MKGTVINLPHHGYDYAAEPPDPYPTHVEFTADDGNYGYWKKMDGGDIALIPLCKHCGESIGEDDQGFCGETCYHEYIFHARAESQSDR